MVSPTFWKMMVTVPFSGSVSAMVRGIRSPYSSTRRMMNCPAFAFRAISGASTSSSVTVGFSSCFLTIFTMSLLRYMKYANLLNWVPGKKTI